MVAVAFNDLTRIGEKVAFAVSSLSIHLVVFMPDWKSELSSCAYVSFDMNVSMDSILKVVVFKSNAFKSKNGQKHM